MSKVDANSQSEARSGAPVWRARLIALVAAGVGAALVSVIGSAVGAEMVATPSGREPTAIGPVISLVMALFAGGLGWLARAVLDRFAPRRAVPVWLIGAAVVFLVEMFPPFFSDASTGTTVVLIVMHVVVAAILVPVLGRPRKDREA